MKLTCVPSLAYFSVGARPQGQVRALPFQGDDTALVAGLLRGHPGAAEALHRRFARRIHGLLYRILGPDPELEDAVHDTFVRALEALPKLKDPAVLESWILGVTVRTARTRLQRRSRRRWLVFMPADEVPEAAYSDVDPSLREALVAAHRVLEELPVEERLALVLRSVERMTVSETAAACGLSISTAKRRISRAEKKFVDRARREPALDGWLQRVAS